MSVASRVREALPHAPPWPRALVAELVAQGCAALATSGLRPDGYGTLRALTRDPTAPRRALASIPAPTPGGAPIRIETFGDAMPDRYRELGMAEAEVEPDRLRAAFEQANAVLRLAPDAAAAVSLLVRSIHVLAVDGPEFDVSYSDPEIAFSIFVGVHPEPIENDAVRLAEALLHESMHLLLTLAEAEVPLVATDLELHHSPWQGRARPVQGILHGLFVFRAIQRLLRTAAASGALDSPSQAHANVRLAQIEADVAGIAGVAESRDLTPAGRTIAAALLRGGA